MSDTVIHVENLSKRYVIGHQRRKGDGLRHAIEAVVRNPFQWLRDRKQAVLKEHEEFWALRDISFEIKQGDVVGIIGRNGAGKSTLLKILSRITEPTSGRIRLKGRVASLLEVGTGFHPELTGRENIFLNGAILGMSKVEIKRKFDEIVAFSEVEKFLDTPVKRYSSGMYVRLAFAVAAHLEPEILIVDEVLAVGDAEFQKKCLGKMQDVSTKEGRTVLFVSHNMDAISRLCGSAIMLNKGCKEYNGSTKQAVQKYLENFSQIGQPGNWLDIAACPRRGLGTKAFFHSATYLGQSNEANFWPLSEGELLFKLRISSDLKRTVPSLGVTILSPSFHKLVNADTVLISRPIHLEKGLNEVHIKIQRLHLKPGRYLVGLWLANSVNDPFDHVESAFEISVLGENNRLGSAITHDGVVTCDFTVYQPALVI